MTQVKSITRLTLLMLLLLTGLNASATIYTWSRYNLSFETPEDGFVTFNTPTRFEVQWEDMVMTVQLYSKDKGDEKQMLTENLQRKALGYSMYDLKNGKIKVKGFKKTYSIEGTMPDGSRAIIADLVSKQQNLIVEVTVNYLYGNRETVEDMIKSFGEAGQAQAHVWRRRRAPREPAHARGEQAPQHGCRGEAPHRAGGCEAHP